MTPLDIYLLPGDTLISVAAYIFQLPLGRIDPTLLRIIAAFASWIIWMALLKGTWRATCLILGLPPGRRF